MNRIFLTALTFLITFVIASAGGEFQDLVKTTLDNDAAVRKKKLNKID